ncbi:Tad domain-containing protein, partial [bacterium]|nr:Tad domain-containing protein [bacterium]
MRSRSILKNQNGQMALFLVLIFQVLFVFFAMSINVGLVVFDKINLQNSTDIAAYYAAQKQSEMLNQIAHINYQLRQA